MPKGKGYGGKMPNDKMGKGGSMSPGSGKMGSNHGMSTGLKKSNEMRSDTMKTPNTKNMYPNGLA
ncbi:MAG: hypothetical protein ACR2PR_08085 [Pseudohongiellaceae bacterium]